MRAVNLLPERHRPRQRTAGGSGSSHILLGVLGAVVVAVLMYVLTANSINSAKTDIAKAKAETQAANARAQTLGAYGDFAKVKQQRVDAVKSLAEDRFDWERLVRELAHVLPAGVWIQNVNAGDSAADAQSAGGSSTGSTSSAGSSGGGGPQLTIQGCAPDQAAVAETLVRLRELQGASDVKLDSSTQPDQTSSGGSSGSASASGECGNTHGNANFAFTADVSFDKPAPAPYKPGSVPPSLGGGQ